ncbi:MAG: DUF2141 domain-containing protein [Chitinophagales bacterium]|nr:DUF2141 domain-containing protein [Chitinophagales bacterium]
MRTKDSIDAGDSGKKPLTLIIDNLGSPDAPVQMGIYNRSNKFLDTEDRLMQCVFTPQGDILTAEITDLPYGEYAFALFQDLNRQGKIARNLLGIPTDPFAFSNNYQPSLKAPKFDDCCFDYNADTHTLHISMIRKGA